MKGNLTMKRIVLLIVIVLLAAIVIKGPDSLIGLAKMSRSASDNGGSLPNVIGKATGVTGKKVLVAYFSWGGNTREVAKLIHSKTGGDLFEIKKETPYPKESDDGCRQTGSGTGCPPETGRSAARPEAV